VFVSVIIPTRNRSDVLPALLCALERQDYPVHLMQIVVIDDGSTDCTAELLAQFSQCTPLDFVYECRPLESAGAARNRGLSLSSGDLILFLDADTIPEPDLISKHVHRHKQNPDYGLCLLGKVEMAAELNVPQQARVNEQDWSWSADGLREVMWWEYRTPNTSMKRPVVESVKGFDTRLLAIEDTEFACRLRKLGMRFYCDNRIVAVHYHPMTIDLYLEKGRKTGEAVMQWYWNAPDLRRLLALRYGVFAPEMPLSKKAKYAVRVAFINKYTVDMIVKAGKRLRKYWFRVSEILYRCAFRYQIRRAFRQAFTHASKADREGIKVQVNWEGVTCGY
jgi:glycosyltransferase involved in cell wall biosynthesis